MAFLTRDVTCFRKCFCKIDHVAHMQGALKEKIEWSEGQGVGAFVVVSAQNCKSWWFLFPMP